MKTYNVKFAYNNEGITELQVRRYSSTSAGQAFQKCQEEYPGAKLIEAWKEGGYLDGHGITTYKPPSVAKVQTGPVPRENQLTFRF
jgi:hypothetical protein